MLSVIIGGNSGPSGPFGTCTVRTDILKEIGDELSEYLKHLEYVMEKEV